MASFNKVIIAGNLTRDVELRFLPNGTAVAEIALAVNRNWKNDAGEDKEEVSFINCVVWGKQAETMAQYSKKGNALLVEGRLREETWEDRETKQKRSKLKVVVETFQFLTPKEQAAA